MQIVIIGTGNTATVLGRKLKAAGHDIVQVYGRTPAPAAALAAELGAHSCSDWNAITQQASLYIVAIADRALTGNDIHLRLQDQLVVHTAGAVTKEVLQPVSSSYGVLYPYQSMRKEITHLPEIPFLVDGSSGPVTETLVTLAKTMSHQVSIAGDATRTQYHLCAVMANNFSNYLYTLTEDYCKKNGLNFSNLLPLIDETAGRLHQASPRTVQTGPGFRKDSSTIAQHLHLLQDDPALKKMYELITNEIWEYPW